MVKIQNQFNQLSIINDNMAHIMEFKIWRKTQKFFFILVLDVSINTVSSIVAQFYQVMRIDKKNNLCNSCEQLLYTLT